MKIINKPFNCKLQVVEAIDLIPGHMTLGAEWFDIETLSGKGWENPLNFSGRIYEDCTLEYIIKRIVGIAING